MYTKSYIFFDKNKKSLNILSSIKKKIKPVSFNKANFIIVIGGDGFMLKILKKYYKFNKPFYGINSGSYGFLMNKFLEKKIIQNLSKLKTITINPLEMIVKNKFGNQKNQ